MIELEGISASKGVAIGQAIVIQPVEMTFEHTIAISCDAEIRRLKQAKEVALKDLQKLQDYTVNLVGESEGLIFDVHQTLLTDGCLIDRASVLIQQDAVKAELAIQRTSQEYILLFDQMEDDYMSERANDIKDVSNRLIRILTGQEEKCLRLTEAGILVISDLLPSDLMKADQGNILGIVTEKGNKMSHASILARTMGIPMVVGVGDLLSIIQNGDEIAISGNDGKVIIHPEPQTKNWLITQQRAEEGRLACLKKFQKLKSITGSGIEIKLKGNVGNLGDVDAVIENGGEGIGLFRSEMLYMNTNILPSEESQLTVYQTALEKMETKPVIIRTLDLGGEKAVPFLNIPVQNNPALGYRGIRVSLDMVEIFKTQLRALLRASVYGKLGIMFPMISSLEELGKVRLILEEAKKELINKNIPFDPDLQIGIVVETPAAAMMSEQLAKEVDFFSIGTNDLTQYTVAVDRANAQVGYLYDTHHPAVLKLIQLTIENGHAANIPVEICGEAATDPMLIKLFVDMGVDGLSVNPNFILQTREIIRKI